MTGSSAEAIRLHNRELDGRLLELFGEVPESRLHEQFGDEWTVAHNLAHIAEFPGYFARQLREWISGERVVMGRVAEYDADRTDALAQADRRGLADLRRQASISFAEMGRALEDLEDEHLSASTHNVKYGEESLTAFLDRYVIGHKQAHIEQLENALAAVRAIR